MKILDQCSLVWRDGSVERIHEVDLIEVGTNKYVVNFRYGKRGSNLKDGSRTTLPVDQVKAREEYEKEIRAKLDKGYVVEKGAIPGGGAAPRPGEGAPTPPPPPTPVQRPTLRVAPPPTVSEARLQAILNRLAQGDNPLIPQQSQRPSGSARFLRNRVRKPRPLHRVILRAGELRIRAAEALLLNLLPRADARRAWCIANALGKLGSEACIDALVGLRTHSEDAVRRQAFEALRRLSDANSRQGLAEDRLGRLPAPLQLAARSGATTLITALKRHIEQPTPERVAILHDLYLIDTPDIRVALMTVLREIPLRPPFFRVFRWILKAAEYRMDAEVWGLCCWRLETTRAMFQVIKAVRRSNPQDRNRPISITFEGKRRTFVRAQLGQVSAELAYSDRSRAYLRARSLRRLRVLGKERSEEFVKLAVGMLLPYQDSDAGTPRQHNERDAQNWRRTIVRRWGPWAAYPTLNFLLYGKSPRFFKPKRRRLWQIKEGVSESLPLQREESFPELWDTQPAGLLHLLSESNCLPVHEFAARALRHHPDLIGSLDSDMAILLLGRPYDITAALGYEVARRHYRADAPQIPLLLAVATSIHRPARDASRLWIRANLQAFIAESSVIATLAACAYPDARAFARELIRSNTLPTATAQALTARLIAALRKAEEALAQDLCQTLEEGLGSYLNQLELPILLDLLGHRQSRVQMMAAQVLLARGELSETALQALLASSHASVRAMGVQMLSRIPEATLAIHPGLLLALCTSVMGDIRSSARPLIERLARNHPAQAGALAGLISAAFLKDQAEGVYAFMIGLLRAELLNVLHLVPAEQMWSLIRSKRPEAQEAGGVLLLHHRDIGDLDFAALAGLASHEVLAVRSACWAVLERSVTVVAQHLDQAIRILDARWEDSRNFAFRYFRERFAPELYSPDILMAMADSLRPDVQAFAEQMLLRCFQEKDGQTYLLRLSEHPAARLQGLAVGYLEDYAKGDIERLSQLRLFFKTVLSRVNKGRVAKARLHAFLANQAQQSEAAALIVAEILGHQSATMAIQDKSACIETLLHIHLKYPSLPTLIMVEEPPLRA